ncbi:hypothetical protein ABIF26_006435 [Bradyrhizobium elkanii]|uniref:hypothetical protein n=1 Tax=Bradyrhizobium elkanii TaxID=29448 RepID=UPI00351528E9
MSIIEDFDSIGSMLRQLETDKGKHAVTEPASEVTDQVRHEFYSMYGFGYQAPKTDAA